MRVLNGNIKNFDQKLVEILNKRKISQFSVNEKVKRIINSVKKDKDKAVLKYEKKFSNLSNKNVGKSFKFSNKEINKIISKLDKQTKKSIDLAFQRIKNFHLKQKFKPFNYKDKLNNILSYRYSPIESIGVYVPGGTASYPSSVLMNCIPAIVAKVKNIYLTTPALSQSVNPAIIYAAKKCGVKEIYKIGGAQAIAALAFGTKQIKKVYKIVGPGNAFVATAKKEVFGEVGIDMIAGPSEVTVLADKFSEPAWVAADLIAQAEHDILSQSILISNDIKLIKKVNEEIFKQLKKLPRKNIILKSISNHGLSIYCSKMNSIYKIINQIAPEHLELFIKNPEKIASKISNAGSIFLGKYSPEAMGDYLAGPNHVLPTSGSAKFSSGLSVFDFLKRHSQIKISKSGIERLGTSVINLANYENLQGHANSVSLRLRKEK